MSETVYDLIMQRMMPRMMPRSTRDTLAQVLLSQSIEAEKLKQLTIIADKLTLIASDNGVLCVQAQIEQMPKI